MNSVALCFGRWHIPRSCSYYIYLLSEMSTSISAMKIEKKTRKGGICDALQLIFRPTDLAQLYLALIFIFIHHIIW